MIAKHVVLPLPLDAAFRLFTERIGEWWPPERRHTGDPRSAIFLEATGRFAERAGDGREVPLGRVRAWEPPVRLVLDWFPGTDPEHPTEVVITFAAHDDGTRVEVLHRPTAASRDLFDARAPRYGASWDLVLAALRAACV